MDTVSGDSGVAQGPNGGPPASEWLPAAVQPPPPPKPPSATPGGGSATAEPGGEGGAGVRDLLARLERAEARSRRQASEAERLVSRLAAAEARAQRAEAALARLRGELEASRRALARRERELAAAGRGSATVGEASGGRLDLNAASFEELRSLGLSVSQAARFVAQRDERGGLRSPEDVDSLYGLPREVKEALKARAAG